MINNLGSDKFSCVFNKCQLLKLAFLLGAKNACVPKNDLIIFVLGEWDEISRSLSFSYGPKFVNLDPGWIVLCSYVKQWDFKLVTHSRGTGGGNSSACRLYKGRSGKIYA